MQKENRLKEIDDGGRQAGLKDAVPYDLPPRGTHPSILLIIRRAVLYICSPPPYIFDRFHHVPYSNSFLLSLLNSFIFFTNF